MISRRPPERAPGDAGFTLLELSAVIAIVIIASFVVIAGVRSISAASMTTATARLAASVRYLHDLAVLNNRPYRLVIDMQDNAYWGEVADAPDGCSNALLASEDEMTFGIGDAGRRGADDGEVPSPEGGGGQIKKAGGHKDNLLRKKSLPKGIEFSGVMTSHQSDLTEDGEAEVFFFPAGYVERARIYVMKDEEIHTVETVPLKGIALVHNEELDPGDLLDM